MKRAIWLGVFVLSGCGDRFVHFDQVGPDSGGTSAGRDAGDAGTSGALATGGSTAAGGSAAVGGNETSHAGTATGGSLSTSGAASGGTDNAAGADSAAAGESNGGAPPTVQADPFDLVDDMEGAFPSLPAREGRDGVWFSAHDASYGHITGPSAVRLEPARGSSHVAAGLSGGGFTGWGAQLGVSLTSTDEGYDANAFCGVHFWVKGSGAGWTLLVSDRSSVPEGGVCNPYDYDGQNACYRFVGKGLVVSHDWREVSVGFDDLRLVADPSSPRRLETAQIYDILFNFYGSGGETFDLQVDDLSFIRKGSALCP